MSRPASTPAGLRLVRYGQSRTRQWSWFCGYCAAPPSAGNLPERFTRVCERCGLGILLEAPADVVPARDEAFLVLDDELVIRALSKRAERLLQICEPDVVGQTLVSVLPHAARTRRLELSVKGAAEGDETLRHALVRVGPEPEARLSARIACCGPPPAALVVLQAQRRPSAR